MRKMKRRHLVGGGMEGADGLTDQYAHYQRTEECG